MTLTNSHVDQILKLTANDTSLNANPRLPAAGIWHLGYAVILGLDLIIGLVASSPSVSEV